VGSPRFANKFLAANYSQSEETHSDQKGGHGLWDGAEGVVVVGPVQELRRRRALLVARHAKDVNRAFIPHLE
jgi:hypothetical protein